MRYLLLALLLPACSTSEATAPAVQERNLVCERVKLLSPDAACVPEFSGASDLVTHTARVTVGAGKEAKVLVCGLNAGQLAMACSGLEVQQPKPGEDAKFTTAEGKGATVAADSRRRTSFSPPSCRPPALTASPISNGRRTSTRTSTRRSSRIR